jgi:hypothetical protein
MPDTQIDDVLIAAADLGLPERDLARVDDRCLTALRRELDDAPRRRPSRLRRRAVVAPIALLIAGTAGAVGYAALTSPSTASAGIECHTGATLAGSATITHLDGGRAVDVCARLWAQGVVAPGERTPSAPLHACVAADGTGAIHVLEGDGVCTRVGLREDADAGADPQSAQYGRFAQRLTADLQRPDLRCATAAQLSELVGTGLREAGLSGWTITDQGGYDTQRPCASVSLDSAARTATISPVER